MQQLTHLTLGGINVHQLTGVPSPWAFEGMWIGKNVATILALRANWARGCVGLVVEPARSVNA